MPARPAPPPRQNEEPHHADSTHGVSRHCHLDEPEQLVLGIEPPLQASSSAYALVPNPTQRTGGLAGNLEKQRTVLYHGLGLASTALIGMLPALWEVAQHLRADQSTGIAPWAHVVLCLAVIQLGYAIYLIQIPDWSSAWVTALACLVASAIYAVGLGVGLSAGVESSVITNLGLADRLHAGQLTRWCLIMLSLSLLSTYFLGRLSLSWHRRETYAG